MGNRISTTEEPVIMTGAFLEKKVMQNMVKLQDLDISQLQKLVNIDGLEYDAVFSLDLEHQNLANIDDLWRFKLLTKLEMPNNLLEKIEGLECLVNLQSLDLSFNFITCIKNLENLMNLINLSMTSNEITVLENMDSLKKLETFSIRHNKIKSFENVHYLERFKNLSKLAIDKNPFMKEADARLHIIAALPQLKYLDFNVVTHEEIKEAFEKFPPKTKSIYTEPAKEKFKCPFPHSDKEAYVDGLANGQGFQSFLLSDKNYQLLHSFPLACEISEEHCSKVNPIFEKWHERGHEYYQQIQNEKSQFLLMVSKAKGYSLDVYRKEEMEFISLKEKIPKELCFIYHNFDADEEKEKEVAELKKKYEVYLQNTFRNFMNSSCLYVDLMSNMCKIYEKEISLLNVNYIKEVENFIGDIMDINREFANKLQEFYFNIHESEFDILNELTEGEEFTKEGEEFTRDSSFLQLIQKKDLIKMTLKLSIRIHSIILKERINCLKSALYCDLVKTMEQVSEEAFIQQSEQTRNTVIFCNKQNIFLHKLFSKNNIFKHYLGYR